MSVVALASACSSSDGSGGVSGSGTSGLPSGSTTGSAAETSGSEPSGTASGGLVGTTGITSSSGSRTGAASGGPSGASDNFDSGSETGSEADGGPSGSAEAESGATSGSTSSSRETTADSGVASAFDASIGQDSGGSTASGDSGVKPPVHTGNWRIEPFGDSITGSMCPPQLLSQELIDNGHKNFVFVGNNLNNQSCYGAPSLYTEGHGGYLAEDFLPNGIHASQLQPWCASDKPDILLFLMGTNDVWGSHAIPTILSAFDLILQDHRKVSPNVIVFVGKILPMHPSGCANCEANVEALNAQIPTWASSQSSAASPIYWVDVNSAVDQASYVPNSTYTTDGVHPTPAASKLVADKWYQALVAHGLF